MRRDHLPIAADVSAAPFSHAPVQANNDAEVIRLWLHGRPANTQRAYKREISRFCLSVNKPMAQITLGDIQNYADANSSLKASSVARALAAIKSLLSFASQIGYLRLNVGPAVRLPVVRNRRAERILSEEQVMKMLALTTVERDHALLRLAYSSALRISELASLCWRDLQVRQHAGQVSVLAKGGKTHVVLLSEGTWQELIQLRHEESLPESPVFVSRKGNYLSTAQIHRIVASAAKRAGIQGRVSAHWLRHAHASHALDRGAPIHMVSATLNHSNLATTSVYVHARPSESSATYLGV